MAGTNIYGELIKAQLQNSASDLTPTSTGLFYFNTTTGLKWYNGSAWKIAADLDSSQTLTNKTFSTGTVISSGSLIDSGVSFVDNGDNTKKLAFEISGVTTGTTRTWTVPDASSTLVGTDVTQTLSAKTLASPNVTTQETYKSGAEIRFEESGGGTDYTGFKAPSALATNLIYTMPSAFPTVSGQVLSGTTGGVLSWVSVSTATASGNATTFYSTKTTTYTAVNGDRLWANSSGGAFTITLPASPSVGDYIEILDPTGSWATNNITVGRNGNKIRAASADLTLNVNWQRVTLVYFDATNGWGVF